MFKAPEFEICYLQVLGDQTTTNTSTIAKETGKNDMLKDDHEKPIEVIYKFQLPDHEKDLKIFQSAPNMVSALWTIKMVCREHWKHGKFQNLDDFCDAVLEVVNLIDVEDMYE